jgi:fructosamine-3-kinase
MDILKNIENEKINGILKEANIFADDVIIKKIVGENSNSVFRVNCNDESYALKIFSGKDRREQFQANIFFNEFARKNNIKTPKIIHSGINKKSSDDCWILWEWFDGKSFFETVSVSDKKKIALEAGIQLRKIHEIKISEIENKFTKNKNIKKSLEFFKNRIEGFVEKGCNAFSQEELNDIFRFTIESEELSSFADIHLLHGDFTGGNVLSSQEEICIIDPGEIVIGDPMSDLGYSQNTSLNEIFRAGVLDGYTKNNALTDVEHDRFLRWRLLRQCIVACRAVLNKNKNAERLVADARNFLGELRNKKITKSHH